MKINLIVFIFLFTTALLIDAYANGEPKIIDLYDKLNGVHQQIIFDQQTPVREFKNYVCNVFGKEENSVLLYVIINNGLKVIPQPSILYPLVTNATSYLVVFREKVLTHQIDNKTHITLPIPALDVNLKVESQNISLQLTQEAKTIPLNINFTADNFPIAMRIDNFKVPQITWIFVGVFGLLWAVLFILFIYQLFQIRKLRKIMHKLSILEIKNEDHQELLLGFQ